MSLWNNLILCNKNRIIFFNNLIDCLFYQFFLNDRYSNSSLPLHHFFNNLLNYYFNWFYHFLNCFNIPNIVLYNLLNLQLFFNNNFVFSWNLYWSIFFNYNFHLCRYFYSFRFLNHLINWHLTILSVDYRLFNIIICLHRNFLYHFNWVIMSDSNTNLIMNHFRLRDRNNLRSRLIDHVFFRNSDNIIHNFLDIFGYFYNFGSWSEHTDYCIDLIKVNNLSLNHSKHSLI